MGNRKEAMRLLRDPTASMPEFAFCEAMDDIRDGYIYVLQNEFMPSIYKVGYSSRRPALRIKELSASTSVPAPFCELASYHLPFSAKSEKAVHHLLFDCRVNRSREFFGCCPSRIEESVIQAVMKICSKSTIETNHEEFRQWLGMLCHGGDYLIAYSEWLYKHPRHKAKGVGFDG